MATCYVLVDQDVTGDRRVERSIAQARGRVRILDVRDNHRAFLVRVADWLTAVWLAARALATAAPHTLRGVVEPVDPPFSGLLACLRSISLAVATARRLAPFLRRNPGATVHAHDLVAGFAAALAQTARSNTTYDSHEVQVQRHRKAGALRMLIEHQHERRALEAAGTVLTVNEAVAAAMLQLHPWLQTPPTVVPNDFFTHRPIQVAKSSATPTLVYVGRAVQGRQLGRLSQPPERLGFDVRAFLLGGATWPGVRQSKCWQAAGADYEEVVASLLSERRCLMWCCLDARALSYRLATPNKLFQALALGMPVLASPGTYLARIVTEHRLGAVDDGNLPALARRVRSHEYEDWIHSVATFRSGLKGGTVRL